MALRKFVKDPRFDQYVMTAVLLANLVTVAIETTLDMENLPSQALWQVREKRDNKCMDNMRGLNFGGLFYNEGE
jgi:hypothetical protein